MIRPLELPYYKLTKWWRAVLPLCLVLIIMLSASAGPVRGEEAEPVRAEPDADESDVYYNAMLRSIELDKGRWKSFSRSMESGPWFYDTQSLKRNGNKVTAQVTVYPHPQKTERYNSVHVDHTKIRKIVFLTEINCSQHSYRQPEIRVYGYFSDLLAEHLSNGKKSVFSPIRPGTTTDTLRTLVCIPDRKKK
ncbi:MAG: hypothetical protein JJE30_01985 [Desulfuromonadales bacterium]|nr:hypothetical protein [Desulfuromonadales bacterium]